MTSTWSLMLFAAFAVIGGAAALTVAVGEWRGLSVPLLQRMTLAAIIALAAGIASAVLSLGRPALVFGALANPHSGVFRELVSTGAALIFLVLYAAALWRGASALTCRVLSCAAGLCGLLSAASVGAALYMPWHTGWHTVTIAFPAALWAVAGAAALSALLLEIENAEEAGEDEELLAETERARALAAPLSLLPAVGIAVYLAALAWTAAPTDAPTVSRLVSGDLALPFWAGAGLIGTLIPFAALFLTRRRPMNAFVVILVVILAAVGTAAFEFAVSQLGGSVWHFFQR
ncbi:hypothetical protein [Sutterella sp.]|uniref:hypothetical protein n=1 Tax=Sutterella sp. TaxID=1981025 RepID=UPI0026E0C5AE|nr:hypothetical protein [Sutterella sp.]MDO5530900.1 hypothetical protein [Sutterella sp.]